MKLTILGTGNATVTECYNTCFVLSEKDQHFLVDAGGGNQILKILKEVSIPITELHHIFVTHEHLDHVLGVLWLIRMIGQNINKGNYDGHLQIYCHQELAEKIRLMAEMTIQHKVCRHFDNSILFNIVEHEDQRNILNSKVTFFDIGSSKAKQFGFTMDTPHGIKVTCLGDEPYNSFNHSFVTGSHWLLHEAFCLYSDAKKFHPYEKHHSTVREACQLAEELHIPNLILYHTEETHLKDRKQLYIEEGKHYYHGNLYVPNDLETFKL